MRQYHLQRGYRQPHQPKPKLHHCQQTPTTTLLATSTFMPTSLPTGKSYSKRRTMPIAQATLSLATSTKTLIPKSYCSRNNSITLQSCSAGVIRPMMGLPPCGNKNTTIHRAKRDSHYSTSTKTASWNSSTATTRTCVSSTAAGRVTSLATTPYDHTTFTAEG